MSAVDMLGAMHTNFPDIHLAVGSGYGYLTTLLRARFSIKSMSPDYTDNLIELKYVPIKVAVLNVDKLPFCDEIIDVVMAATWKNAGSRRLGRWGTGMRMDA